MVSRFAQSSESRKHASGLGLAADSWQKLRNSAEDQGRRAPNPKTLNKNRQMAWVVRPLCLPSPSYGFDVDRSGVP